MAKRHLLRKPKKLKNLNHFSLPLEQSKWSLGRKNQLGLTLGSRQFFIHLPHKGIIERVGKENIKSVMLVFSNDDLYVKFTYKKPLEAAKTFKKSSAKKLSKRVKTAGIDVGINNLLSIAVDDEESKSLIVSGGKYINYNVKANKNVSGISSSIDKLDDGDRKDYLFSLRRHIFELRNRFFSSEWDKISSLVVRHLKICDVKQLVISKNLSFAKQSGEIKMGSATQQKFYQIPFGKLLNAIERKAQEAGISVVVIDEAYTSKTSCLSADVNKNQRKRSRGGKPASTDFNGSRVRGCFKEAGSSLVFHSDLNGAFNHIKVAVGRLKTDLRSCLEKLCRPVKVKSANEFADFLRPYPAIIVCKG